MEAAFSERSTAATAKDDAPPTVNASNLGDVSHAFTDSLKRVRVCLTASASRANSISAERAQYLVETRGYTESHKHGDTKLLLGWAGVFVACASGAYGHWLAPSFAESKTLVGAGVALYVLHMPSRQRSPRVLTESCFRLQVHTPVDCELGLRDLRRARHHLCRQAQGPGWACACRSINPQLLPDADCQLALRTDHDREADGASNGVRDTQDLNALVTANVVRCARGAETSDEHRAATASYPAQRCRFDASRRDDAER